MNTFLANSPFETMLATFCGLLLVTLFVSNAVGAEISGTIRTKGASTREMAELAKISFQDALKLVQASYPGKVVEIALESENGFLVYEIELITDVSKQEILIDAGNGATLLMKEKPLKKTKTSAK